MAEVPRNTIWIASLCLSGMILFYECFTNYYQWLPGSVLANTDVSTGCYQLQTRQEWRQLSVSQKTEYISAVKCLRELPSVTGHNHSLFDDFPWVHSRIAHYSAAFLPWHRYFIHIYETHLKLSCGYSGALPYWDWSLDWEDLSMSPIWDTNPGFGGNGNTTSEKSVAYGHCVTDGPFADIVVLFFGEESRRHCLSRGFADNAQRSKSQELIRPDAIERILSIDNYADFNYALEKRPHNAIPRFIRGDFYKVTAPNDPVFFLHHAQLDRLWWMWQQRDMRNRKLAYEGKSLRYSNAEATLADQIDVGTLGSLHIMVESVMDTVSKPLCYAYG